MPDKISPDKRSAIMRSIKGKDTTPELTVRSFLHRAGLRFRLHTPKLPGKPDIVLPRYRTLVFVNGCFWHQHPGCKHSGIPRSNRGYWEPKLKRTIIRDKENKAKLENLGWRVIVLWECEITEEALGKLADSIRQPHC